MGDFLELLDQSVVPADKGRKPVYTTNISRDRTRDSIRRRECGTMHAIGRKPCGRDLRILTVTKNVTHKH